MGEMTRLIYVDDSGAEQAGLIVYGWVEVAPSGWRLGLRSWLELRKRLFTTYAIHPATELHATKFISGRSRITAAPLPQFTMDDGRIRWDEFGQTVAEECLSALKTVEEHVKVGAVYRRTTARRRDYYEEKLAVYKDLVRRIDDELRTQDSFGFITMDGEDLRYRDAHRALKLDSRHLIEDPAYHNSANSQWTQMADLVAYIAFHTINPHAGNVYSRAWWETYLAGTGEITEI